MSNKPLHQLQSELIENKSFIRWVHSEFTEDNDYWSEYVDHYMDNMDEINKAIGIVRHLSFKDIKVVDENKLWKKIAASTAKSRKDQKDSGVVRYLNRWVVLAAAACIAVLFIFRPGLDQMTLVSTGKAEEMTTSLPDGSQVSLDATSMIKYDTKEWKLKRDIRLTGTAFFNVKKGNTFKVMTDQGTVTVLGTSFSVMSRNNTFEVICKTGRVQVENNASPEDKVVISMGQTAKLKNGRLEVTTSEDMSEVEVSWMSGVYTFDNKPLPEVFEELGNQFNVKIELPENLKNVKYTGFFRVGSLDDALYSVTWPMQLKYSVHGKKIVISE